MGVEETDDALLPPPNVGKAASSLAPCHLKNQIIKHLYGINNQLEGDAKEAPK